MKTTRRYDMTTRREAAEATRVRILQAVRSIAYEHLEFEPTLESIATRAGVSVQTVLRHFTTREAVLTAATEAAMAAIAEERRPPEPDVDSAIATIIQHYERTGAFALAMLAREDTDPRVAPFADHGKRVHRSWVAAVFADRLPAAAEPREALLDLLVVATDVYAWKLLRRDRGHDVATVHARMRAMTDALLHSPSEGSRPCPPL